MIPIHELPPRPRYPAGIISIVFHTILFTLLGLLWRPEVHGTNEAHDRKVGIALVKTLPDRVLIEPERLQQSTDTVQETASEPTDTPTATSETASPGTGPLAQTGSPLHST